jgi:hypothetical protein
VLSFPIGPLLAITVLLDDDQIVRVDVAAGQQALQPLPDLGRCRVLGLIAVKFLRPLTVRREVSVAGLGTFDLVEDRVPAGALASVTPEQPCLPADR